MNTIRMFAFAAAVLITALLFRAVADGFTLEKPIPAATVAHTAGTSGSPKPAAD